MYVPPSISIGTCSDIATATAQEIRVALGVHYLVKMCNLLVSYKNQRAYFAIPVSDIKGLMILKNVLSCFKPSYRSVKIRTRFL